MLRWFIRRVPKWFIRRQLDRFEKAWDYDVTYMRELLDDDFAVFRRYVRVAGAGDYKGRMPAEAWHAAKVATVLAEDCGPCTQLGVRMAERAGVPPPVLRAVLAGDVDRLPADAALAYRYTRAVLAHAPADDLREEVVARWGRSGLATLALAITVGRSYPTMKYALGHGQACQRVTVAGEPVLRPAV